MFGIGFGEFAIIFIVLIVAVGPEKLPTLMKTVGRTIRGLRQASRDIRTAVGIDELMREDFNLHTPPARKPQPPQGQPQGRDSAAALRADAPVGGEAAAAAEVAPTGKVAATDEAAATGDAAAAAGASTPGGTTGSNDG